MKCEERGDSKILTSAERAVNGEQDRLRRYYHFKIGGSLKATVEALMLRNVSCQVVVTTSESSHAMVYHTAFNTHLVISELFEPCIISALESLLCALADEQLLELVIEVG